MIMRLKTSSFVEHRTVGEQFQPRSLRFETRFLLPGACTCCNGSSSTSCCGTLKLAQTAGALSTTVANPQPISTFREASIIFDAGKPSAVAGAQGSGN